MPAASSAITCAGPARALVITDMRALKSAIIDLRGW